MPNLIHVPSHPRFKLGRKPTSWPAHHPLVIPFSTVKATHGIVREMLAGPIASFDYRDGLPDDTDALHNDEWGCCTSSAKGHRAQQFTSYRGLPVLPLDGLRKAVEQFFSETTGFDPSAPLVLDPGSGQMVNPTDQGGDMQKIAEYLVETGFPMPDGTRDKLAFALQIDPASEADLAFCGLHCQGIDFGIVVTTSIMPSDGSPPPRLWTTAPDDEQLGGHDVMSMARRPNGNWAVDSWGGWYEFDESFRKRNVELAFAYVGEDMLREGKTVMGLDLAGWQTVIAAHGQAA